MVTQEQGQQQFDAADRIEADVLKGRWKGIVAEKLWLIECEQGIMLEVELDKAVKGLRLIGTPDATDDGQYLLQLTMLEGRPCPDKAKVLQAATDFSASPDKDIIAEKYVANDQIAPVCEALLDKLFSIQIVK